MSILDKALDKAGVNYLWGKIKEITNTKVDKVEGKGLSTEDFTTEQKTKLEELKNYTLPEATAETLGGVKVGAGLTINQGVISATGGGTADAVDWENITNKPEVALKSDISKVYRFKGDKSSFETLPETGNEIGDVWNTLDTGMNYGWTGELWDPLGQIIDIQPITNAEIDDIINGTYVPPTQEGGNEAG